MSRVPADQRLTPFGRVVMSLAAERGIASRAGLLRVLGAAGYEFKTERVAAWLYGRNQVDKSFPLAITKVLKPTEEQRNRLAVAFMLGQDPDEELDLEIPG